MKRSAMGVRIGSWNARRKTWCGRSGMRMTMCGERRLLAIFVSAIIGSSAGCYHPSEANIQLRKDRQQLQEQVANFQQQLQAAQARIAGLESQHGTLPSLPQERLDRMVT